MAITIRRNATSLTAAEKTAFVQAVLALKQNGKYDQYVTRHAQATVGGIHKCSAFLPWHRMFLLEFEHDLQAVSGNPNLFLPYWDWTKDALLSDPASSSVWGIDFMGGNGDPNDNDIVKTGPFQQGAWEIVDHHGMLAGPLLRSFATAAQYLPERKDVVAAVKRKRYDRSPWNDTSKRFRNRLEGWLPNPPKLHNLVHVWVGGSMLPMTSPNDPIFFLHHCFVDKIWSDWQKRHPNQGYRPTGQGPAGQNLNDQMEPTVYGTSSPAATLNELELGYTYDEADRWEKPGCTWITRLEEQCTESYLTVTKECKDSATASYQKCTQEADQGYLDCEEKKDQGHYKCDREEDQGYKECCTWIPCKWLCDSWVWIKHLVCVSWIWIENIVCVSWVWIKNIVCVVWTWVTTTICLVWTCFVMRVCVAFTWVMRRILFCG